MRLKASRGGFGKRPAQDDPSIRARAARTNAKLKFAWCSRGCFGKKPAQEEPQRLRGIVVLAVLAVFLAVGLAVVLAVVLAIVLAVVHAVVLAVVLEKHRGLM